MRITNQTLPEFSTEVQEVVIPTEGIAQQPILDEFVDMIGRKDRVGLKAKLTKDYTAFVKNHSEEELAELRKQNDEDIEALKTKMTGQNHKLKSGSPSAILALRKDNMTRAKKQRKPKSGSPSDILAIRREEAV